MPHAAIAVEQHQLRMDLNRPVVILERFTQIAPVVFGAGAVVQRDGPARGEFECAGVIVESRVEFASVLLGQPRLFQVMTERGSSRIA